MIHRKGCDQDIDDNMDNECDNHDNAAKIENSIAWQSIDIVCHGITKLNMLLISLNVLCIQITDFQIVHSSRKIWP